MGLVTILSMPVEIPEKLKRLLSGSEYNCINKHLDRYFGKRKWKKRKTKNPLQKHHYTRNFSKIHLIDSIDNPTLFKHIDKKYIINGTLSYNEKLSEDGVFRTSYSPNVFSNTGLKYIDIQLIAVKDIYFYNRGANKKFYDDNIWYDEDKICVFDKNTLIEHHNKYFSGSEDGNNSYGMTNEECRNGFYENIIKHFKEGKTFVMYS